MNDAIIVFTNLPDREAALKLANELVAKKLAACVNVLSECTSVYRWKGTLETAREVPVLIKTRAEADRVLPENLRSFMNESRRLVNRRLKQELRLKLRYPNVRHEIGRASCRERV